MSRVPSGPQSSSGTFRSGAAAHGVSIKSGMADDVVGMQVREEQLRHGVHRKAGLNQTLHEPPPSIEEKAFAASLDERADAGFVDVRTRSAGRSQQRDADVLRRHIGVYLPDGLRERTAAQKQEENDQKKPGSRGHRALQ